MRYVIWTFLMATLTVPFVTSQNSLENLRPNTPVTFSLVPDASKTFSLRMKEDEFAEFTWLSNDNLLLRYDISDPTGRQLEFGDSRESDSALFIAPSEGEYRIRFTYDKESEVTGPQSISMEYRNSFRLPTGTKQRDVRSINGYTVKILITPSSQENGSESLVLIERAGKLKRVLKSFGDGKIAGHFFGDDLTRAFTANARKSKMLVKATSDLTGDGVPDVMIDHYSGGAHCCFVTYFLSLGDRVELIETIGSGHVGVGALRKNPKGGLLFETADNAFAYWLTSFADSPFPDVILEFDNNKLRPNFETMKKPAPPLAGLKAKARATRLKISKEPYTDESGDEFPFWGEILDLIYSGNETLAWQYLDLVWPAEKQGKALFVRDFKKQLSESYFGTRNINRSSSF